MQAIPAVLGVMSFAGSVLGGLGSMQEGRAQNAMAKYEARQMEAQAKAAEAAGQRASAEKLRESRLLQSRALAIAGASGAGVSDPNVLQIVSGIAGEGTRNALTESFNARSRAEGLRAQAGATRLTGKNAQKAGFINAGATILEGTARAGSFGLDPKGTSNARWFGF